MMNCPVCGEEKPIESRIVKGSLLRNIDKRGADQILTQRMCLDCWAKYDKRGIDQAEEEVY